MSSSLTPASNPTRSASTNPTAAGAAASSTGSVSSGSSASSSFDEDEYEAELARQEWDRLVNQTKMLVGLAVPFFAAYFGRRVAFKAFHRYAAIGLGKEFWLSWFRR